MFLLAGAVNLVFLLSSFFMLMMTEQVVVEESLECACSAAMELNHTYRCSGTKLAFAIT